MRWTYGLVGIGLLGSVLAIKNFQSKNDLSIATPAYVKAIYSMPVSYDPIKMNDGASLIFSELVYEGLLRFTEDYGVQGALADSWSTSPNGLVLTFKLNSNAKFHNGEKVTANDVVVSLTRNVSPESLVFKYYDVIKGAKDYFFKKAQSVSGLKAINGSTVEIHLEKAFPPILYALAGGTAKILPAKLINNKNFFEKPIGTGPFKIQEIQKNKIFLTRFSDYHGMKPKLSEMILQNVEQKEAMELASQGEIHDLSSWPMNGNEEVFNKGKDISSVVADTWIIGLNTRIKPFDDLKIRQAFQQSVDTDKFKNLFYPDATSAHGYIPPGFPGFRERNLKSEDLKIKIPKTKISLFIPTELSKADEIKKFFEMQLRSKGWNVEVVPIKWEEMMKKYENKSMPSFLVSMIVDYPDPEFLLSNFESSNPDNFSGIKDEKLDELIQKSRKIQDRIKRQKIQMTLADRVNDLSLSVNLFHSRAHYWVNNCIDGFKPNLLAVAYIDYRKVYFNSDCLKGGNKWLAKQ